MPVSLDRVEAPTSPPRSGWGLGLRGRLLAGFVSLALVTGVLGVYAFSSTERLNEDRRVLSKDIVGGLVLLGTYVDESWEGRADALGYLLDDSPERRAALRHRMAEIDARLQALAREVDEADIDGKDRETLAGITAAWNDYRAWRDGALAAADAGNGAGALAAYRVEGQRLAAEFDVATDAFRARKAAVAAEVTGASEATTEQTRAAAAALSLLATTLAFGTSLLLTRSIVGTVGQVARAAKGLARGELEQRIDVRSRDELGEMAGAVREMVGYQRAMAAVADAIARGDLTCEVQPRSERDVLGTAFQRMIDNLRRLVGQLEAQTVELRAQAELLHLAHDAILVRDFETGRIRFWNRGAEAVYGWSQDEARGQVTHTLLQTRFPVSLAELEAELARSGRWEGEVEHTRRDGSRIVVASRQAVQRDEHGRPLATLEINTDITARRQAEATLRETEERNRLALEATTDVIYDNDLRTGRLEFSPNTLEMFGYTPEEMGSHTDEWLAKVHPEDAGRLARGMAEVFGNGLSTYTFEYRMLRKDGSTAEVLTRGQVVRDEQGRPVRAVGAMMDITQRRAVEEMKNQFVSVVSHELRTPLTSIRGSLGLLASGLLGPLSEKGQRMAGIAVANTDRLMRLINDILDIERIESGTVSMHMEACDLGELMAQAAEVMRPMADKAGLSLVVNPQSAPLWADPDRLMQTLTNLLSNAIKFSHPGGTVWLGAERGRGEVVIRVRDQGRGIPPDKLDRIFGRFQQVDASDSREKGGTGLGLAICTSIVQQHGGRIWVESELGAGSTFSVALPELGDELAPAPSEGTPRPVVLLCDDDRATLEVVGTALDQRGYQPVGFTSGAEAVAWAVDHRPAAIVLDLLMPGQTGWETLAALKGRPETCQIPVIIFSVLQPQPGELEQTAAADWLGKPLEPRVLFASLGRAVGRQHGAGRVLIVEDDFDLSRVLAATFSQHGIQTHQASSGSEAIELSQRVDPDLVLLDLGLPDTDGFKVVDWLRRHNRLRRVPLVVYTARDLDESERDRLRLGPTEFLTKGRVDPEECERRVLAVLERVVPARERVAS